MGLSGPVSSPFLKREDTSSEKHLPHEPTHEVVLIDPFKGPNFKSHRELLQRQIASAVNAINAEPETGVRINIRPSIEFDIHDALYSGKKELEISAQKLRNHLTRTQTTLPLIFVTHSIGMCIVDSALRLYPDKLHEEPAGVVLLDGNLDRLSDFNYFMQIAQSLGLSTHRGLSKMRLLDRPARKLSTDQANELSISSDLRALSRKKLKNLNVWLNPLALGNEKPLAKRSSLYWKAKVAKRILAIHNKRSDPDAIKNIPLEKWFRHFAAISSESSSAVKAIDNDGLSIHEVMPAGTCSLNEIEAEALFRMAQSFWEAGELRNAQNLLQDWILNLGSDLPPGLTRAEDQFQTQQLTWFQRRVILSDLLLDSCRYDEGEKLLTILRGSHGCLPQKQKAIFATKLDKSLAALYTQLGRYTDAINLLHPLLSDSSTTDASTKVQIHRDLSHLFGLTYKHEQAKKHMNLADRMLEQIRAPTKPLSMCYTEAVLAMLRGEHLEALKLSRTALDKYRRLHGEGNLGTIRSGLLHASLLVHLGQHNEADPLCRSIMTLTREGLGTSHPLHLESIEILVRLLRSTFRLLEALATAKSLVQIATKSLTPKHPFCFRARSQLAATHLALGNYTSASMESQKNYRLAAFNLGHGHPESLRCRAELAQALCNLGDFEGALNEVLDTLEDQFNLIDEVNSITKHIRGEKRSQEAVEDFLRSISTDIIALGPASPMAHPNLLHTLHTLALIRLRMSDGARDAMTILEALQAIRKKQYGFGHPATLQTEYDLASAINSLNQQEGQLRYAKDKFQRVWSARCDLFGPDHPDTLIAERAIVLSSCRLGHWESGGPARRFFYDEEGKIIVDDASNESVLSGFDKFGQISSSNRLEEPRAFLNLTLAELENVQHVSRSIALQQEEQLGVLHPDTLLTRIWLLIIELHLCETASLDVRPTWDLFQDRLSDTTIRHERLISSLRMEQSAAIVFQDKHYFGFARDVLERALETAQTQPPHLEQINYSEDHKEDSSEDINIIEDHLFHARLAIQRDLRAGLSQAAPAKGVDFHVERVGGESSTIRDSGIFMLERT